MVNTRTILVDKENAKTIRKYMTEEPCNADSCLGEDETITYTAVFDDGYEMDIKCCGVKYNEGESNLAWAEACLFKNGSEVACSEIFHSFFGTWQLEDAGAIFYVEVKEE